MHLQPAAGSNDGVQRSLRPRRVPAGPQRPRFSKSIRRLNLKLRNLSEIFLEPSAGQPLL
jgi:hypothetical protein